MRRCSPSLMSRVDVTHLAVRPAGGGGRSETSGAGGARTHAAVLGVFREAAHEEDCLAAVASRIETSLARQFRDEQFVTAVLAEVCADRTEVELLSCAHPPPLLLSPARHPFIGPLEDNLPLRLRLPAAAPPAPALLAI